MPPKKKLPQPKAGPRGRPQSVGRGPARPQSVGRGRPGPLIRQNQNNVVPQLVKALQEVSSVQNRDIDEKITRMENTRKEEMVQIANTAEQTKRLSELEKQLATIQLQPQTMPPMPQQNVDNEDKKRIAELEKQLEALSRERRESAISNKDIEVMNAKIANLDQAGLVNHIKEMLDARMDSVEANVSRLERFDEHHVEYNKQLFKLSEELRSVQVSQTRLDERHLSISESVGKIQSSVTEHIADVNQRLDKIDEELGRFKDNPAEIKALKEDYKNFKDDFIAGKDDILDSMAEITTDIDSINEIIKNTDINSLRETEKAIKDFEKKLSSSKSQEIIEMYVAENHRLQSSMLMESKRQRNENCMKMVVQLRERVSELEKK